MWRKYAASSNFVNIEKILRKSIVIIFIFNQNEATCTQRMHIKTKGVRDIKKLSVT